MHWKTKLSILALGINFSFISTPAFAWGQLINYLGTGTEPCLHLELGENGANWNSFSIDYKGTGYVPGSADKKKNFSAWNIKDKDGHYYGTATITSDGNTLVWSSYVGGKDGYYLDGIHFKCTSDKVTCNLTVDSIHIGNDPASTNPFPNTPSARPAVYSDTGTPVVLSVKEANIINDRGELVILKGLVRPSLEWNNHGEFLSSTDFDNMAKWGINVVRIDLYQQYWFDSLPVTTEGSYKQIINAMVYNAIQHKMAIILDLHWTEYGHQNAMANRESIDFWKEVANDYKTFGTVIFELFNEPESQDDPKMDKYVWLTGSEKYAGYQELYNAVRSTGSDNICIVNGLDYAYDLSFVNSSYGVNGDNIVYGSHTYNDKGANDDFHSNFAGVLGHFPLIFTEFGDNQSADFPSGKYVSVYNRVLKFALDNKVSYTGFAWWVEPNNPAFPALLGDWLGTPQYGGILIHADLQSNPGTPFN